MFGEKKTDVSLPLNTNYCSIQMEINGQNVDSIGHFQVLFYLFFKGSLGAQPFIWK